MKQSDIKIVKFGNYYDAQSASGWHAVVKDAEGNWESLSGPYYTYLMASINGKKKLLPT